MDEPIRQKQPVLELNRYRKFEEVPRGLAAASGRAAVAWPRGSARDINVIIARKFLSRGYPASRTQEAFVPLVPDEGVGVAAVIDVPIGTTQ